MTEQQLPLERLIAGWMADEAAGAPEPLLEHILEATRRTAPRPRWLALAAEPTMRGRTGRAAIGLPNRGFVLATALTLLLLALAAVVVGAYLLLNPKPPETADWPGFRGDASRSGVAVEGPTGNPVTLWTLRTTGAVLEVAVIGDRIFFATDDGRLHAASRDGGVDLWSVAAAGPPLSGPYAADGRLYLSDAGGRFHAFTQADGSAIWTSAATYVQASRAIAADGALYFGTGDGFVVAIDAATGDELWRVRPEGATHVDTPAFGGGRVYAGTDGAGFVAVDTATHQVAWAADTDGEDTGSAAVIEGIAYIGASNEADATETLHAFDATTGTPRWTAQDPFLALPTVANGVAYSTSTRGVLEAIDTTTGATKWKVPLEGDTRSPVVAGGVIYLTAGGAHRVYAVDAGTGNELWQVEIDGNANCCVSIARGALFVGDTAGTIYAIGGDGAPIAAHPFPSIETSPSSAGSATASPEPTPLSSIAALTWSTDLRAMGFAPISQIAVDPKTGRIWAPKANTDKMAIFDPDGNLLEEWGKSGSEAGQFDFTRGNGDGYGTLAFASNGSFYVLDVGNRRVQQFDGKRRFIRAWGEFGDRPGQYTDPVGIAVAPDGTVWVLDDVRSVVEHYTRDGEILGSFDPFALTPTNNGANSLAVDTKGNLYVSIVEPSKVAVFDPTGKFLRFVGDGDFVEQPTHMAIDPNGRLFVTQGPDRGEAPGVLAFGPDGTLIGGFGPSGDAVGQLVFPAGIALDEKGGLYVEDSLPESARLMRFELTP
jgi:outer membrane protein assembly factor BamB